MPHTNNIKEHRQTFCTLDKEMLLIAMALALSLGSIPVVSNHLFSNR
jgi:hypothetical protein